MDEPCMKVYARLLGGENHCNRPKGHDGNCGLVRLLQKHCHHPVWIGGRCAWCGLPHDEAARPPEPSPRKQYGSIEGVIVDVRTYYNQPAIRIEERTSGQQVWCLIDEESRQRISGEADFDDVWQGRRIRVRGTIEYSGVGAISRVHATDIEPIAERTVHLREIRDKEFTNGLSPAEYIERLREGGVMADDMEIPCPHCEADINLGSTEQCWDRVSSTFPCPHCGQDIYMGVDMDMDGGYWFLLETP